MHLEICERCEFEHWVCVRSGAASQPNEEGSLSDSADSAAIREIVARKLAERRRGSSSSDFSRPRSWCSRSSWSWRSGFVDSGRD